MIQFFKEVYNGFINSKMSKKILYSSFILLYFIMLTLVTVKINVEVVTPGGINSNISTSAFQNANLSIYIDTENEPGEIFTVGVHSFKKISLFQYLIGKLNNDIDFYDYDPDTDLSASEEYEVGKKSKDLSIINALIVAYTEAQKIDESIKLDYEYEGVLVTLVQKYSKSDLKADDIITHVNGTKINNLEHFRELNSVIQSEEHFKLTVIRDDKQMEINTRKVKEEKTGNYVFGINVADSYRIDKENAFPKYEIHNNYSSVGGSGGAMLALAIYNSLIEEDITNGKRIIGTGTISHDGRVGDIGGVSQKIVTAELYSADVFFCNPEDYEEANNKAKEIEASFKVIRVEQFSDILDYLKGENNG